jgi:putative membrane protein
MRIPAMTTTFALTLALAACGGGEQDGGNQISTDVNVSEDAAANAALGANAATDNEAAVALPTDANGFATAVAASDLYEIESSTLAAQKGTSQEVKEAANHIKTDHQNSAAQLRTAAQQAGVTVAPALDAKKQQMLTELRGASGAEFDRLFLQQQRTAHQEALNLLQSYAKGGDNPALKGFASKATTIIQGHIEHLNSIKAQ